MSKSKPEWAPDNDNYEFASSVVTGIENFSKSETNKPKSGKTLNVNDYVSGIINRDRAVLARAITLIESNSEAHSNMAQEILEKVLPDSGKSIRIAITGAPGAGKSTFIDTFGTFLCDKGYNVAVLAIDPSSSLTKGSILGDKTRMENLSRNDNAFIRPSPSSGTLGGVAGKTRESIFLCEAFGFDIIIIETIGVGQSEIVARSLCDMFILLLLPGEGDELQGIKKGTVELSDIILINKSDGDNVNNAKLTQHQYKQAVHYIQNATKDWETKVMLISALTGLGMEDVFNEIINFQNIASENGSLINRRQHQLLAWFYSLLDEKIRNSFYNNSEIAELLPNFESNIFSSKTTVTKSVNDIFSRYLKLLK